MTDKARIKIAAGVTALFLAGISAAGLAARDGQPQAATTATLRRPIATPAADRSGRRGLGEDRGVAAASSGSTTVYDDERLTRSTRTMT